MDFASIPLSYATMESAYVGNHELPIEVSNWLKTVNAPIDAENEQIKKDNVDLVARGLDPKKLKHKNTSCCMQVSVSFNATNSPIQKAGSRDRDNLLLGGKYYILAVNEFRAFLTYKYGPTAQITAKSDIKGRRGIIIFGDAHIELWDGDAELQAPNGKKTKAGKCEFIGSLLSTPPQWFWEVNGDTPSSTATSVVPSWVVGWWTVYDGNTYYYYFFPDGHVVYIEQAPNKHWIPPKTIGNQGKAYTNEKVHGVSIIWALRSGEAEPTCEDFTQLNWSSQTDMNGQSNKYSPLYARKINTT